MTLLAITMHPSQNWATSFVTVSVFTIKEASQHTFSQPRSYRGTDQASDGDGDGDGDDARDDDDDDDDDDEGNFRFNPPPPPPPPPLPPPPPAPPSFLSSHRDGMHGAHAMAYGDGGVRWSTMFRSQSLALRVCE